MKLNPLSRRKVFLTCLAISSGSILLVVPSSANSPGSHLKSSSPEICSAGSGISSCLTVVAVAKPKSTGRKMSGFMENLWKSNSASGPAILGLYELQSCSTNGPSPFQMRCVLWSSAPRSTANFLERRFHSSHLFQLIDVTTFALSATKSTTQLEIDGCLGISVPPRPAPGAWEAISVSDSTLSALTRSGDPALNRAVGEYKAAAQRGTLDPMIRALAAAAAECHRQGLRTAT
jgi:hypothetical protein